MSVNNPGSKGFQSKGGFSKKISNQDQITNKPNIEVSNLNKDPKAAFIKAPNHIKSINVNYPGIRPIFGDPPVFEIDNFFTKEICDNYIKKSEILGEKVIVFINKIIFIRFNDIIFASIRSKVKLLVAQVAAKERVPHGT
jgi:hypothetical protein